MNKPVITYLLILVSFLLLQCKGNKLISWHKPEEPCPNCYRGVVNRDGSWSRIMISTDSKVIRYKKYNTIKSKQDSILLDNASFEGKRYYASQLPLGWSNYGPETQSSPDIQPGLFGVKHLPIDGKSYISLVSRDNATNEGCSQRLDHPLLPGNTYAFSFWLAHSKSFESMTVKSGVVKSFNTHIKLRVFGYDSEQDKMVLLGETEPVDHENWIEYRMKFDPQIKVEYIVFQAAHPDDMTKCGNILLDHCSAITRVR